MKYLLTLATLFVLTSSVFSQQKPSSRFADIKIDTSYEHLKWGILPEDLVYHFGAYTTSFDSDDNNPCLDPRFADCQGDSDIWGIPEWVAYEIKALPPGKVKPKYTRPSPWLTDDALHANGIAPSDATYATESTSKLKEVKSNYRYVRGHMCPKDAADRISKDAGFNTHTVLNAVPQLQWQNNGIWKALENMCTDWADEYNRVWVISGPVFFNKNPSVWLGQRHEVMTAVPDAIFKIVIREDQKSKSGATSLAFVIPNVISDDLNDKQELYHYLTTVEDVQDKTGLTFFTNLSHTQQDAEVNRNSDLTHMRMIMDSLKGSDNRKSKDSVSLVIDQRAQQYIKAW